MIAEITRQGDWTGPNLRMTAAAATSQRDPLTAQYETRTRHTAGGGEPEQYFVGVLVDRHGAPFWDCATELAHEHATPREAVECARAHEDSVR